MMECEMGDYIKIVIKMRLVNELVIPRYLMAKVYISNDHLTRAIWLF